MRVLFTYQNMCIMLKIHLVHLKSDFITLKSIEGLAALYLVMLSKSEASLPKGELWMQKLSPLFLEHRA